MTEKRNEEEDLFSGEYANLNAEDRFRLGTLERALVVGLGDEEKNWTLHGIFNNAGMTSEGGRYADGVQIALSPQEMRERAIASAKALDPKVAEQRIARFATAESLKTAYLRLFELLRGEASESTPKASAESNLGTPASQAELETALKAFYAGGEVIKSGAYPNEFSNIDTALAIVQKTLGDARATKGNETQIHRLMQSLPKGAGLRNAAYSVLEAEGVIAKQEEEVTDMPYEFFPEDGRDWGTDPIQATVDVIRAFPDRFPEAQGFPAQDDDRAWEAMARDLKAYVGSGDESKLSVIPEAIASLRDELKQKRQAIMNRRAPQAS